MIALNDGAGHFSRVDPRQWRGKPYEGRYLGAADFDGDGDVDLVGLALVGENKGKEFATYGMTATIYDNQGRSVFPPLPYRSPDEPWFISREDAVTSTAPGATQVNSLFITDIQR